MLMRDDTEKDSRVTDGELVSTVSRVSPTKVPVPEGCILDPATFPWSLTR